MTAWEDRTCAESPSAWDIDSVAQPWQRQAIADAKTGCRACPLLEACVRMLADRVEREGGHHDIVGVIAGTDATDRQRIWGRASRVGGIEHGTPKGYRQHARRGIPYCQDCRDANTAEKAAQRAPREHGTTVGYRQHRELGEPACGPCKAAVAARQRARKASA